MKVKVFEFTWRESRKETVEDEINSWFGKNLPTTGEISYTNVVHIPDKEQLMVFVFYKEI
jgi:hypothetical protein